MMPTSHIDQSMNDVANWSLNGGHADETKVFFRPSHILGKQQHAAAAAAITADYIVVATVVIVVNLRLFMSILKANNKSL